MNDLLCSAKDVVSIAPDKLTKAGFITASTVITAYIFYKVLTSGKSDSCPVVPYTNPFNGSSDEYRKNSRAFIEKWTEKLGPVYRVHLFGRIHTIVSGKYVHEVYKDKNFSFAIGNSKRFGISLMTGTIQEDFDVKYDIVSKIVPVYFNRRLKDFAPLFTDNLNDGATEILGSMRDPVEIPHLYPLILRMITRASASVYLGEELCKNPEILDIFQNITTDIASLSPRVHKTWMEPFVGLLKLRMWAIGKFSAVSRSYRKRLNQILSPEIDLRLKKMQDLNWKRPDDVLQGLIEYGAPPGQDLCSIVISRIVWLIFASVNTTTREGVNVFYRLLSCPEYVDEIIQEQQEVLNQLKINQKGSCGEVFTTDVIRRMTKLDSLCRESFRFINQFYDSPHTNISKHEVTLSNGVVIEPDGDVLINMYHNHQINNWSENAAVNDRHQFKPFRHIISGKSATNVGEDDYLTFGIGRHSCPGRFFAVHTIKAAVSLLIHGYEIRPSGDIAFPSAFGTYMPSGPVTFTKRTR